MLGARPLPLRIPPQYLGDPLAGSTAPAITQHGLPAMICYGDTNASVVPPARDSSENISPDENTAKAVI